MLRTPLLSLAQPDLCLVNLSESIMSNCQAEPVDRCGIPRERKRLLKPLDRGIFLSVAKQAEPERVSSPGIRARFHGYGGHCDKSFCVNHRFVG